MTTATLPTSPPSDGSLADLLERLGSIPLSRIRSRPYPGSATEDDVLAAEGALDKRLCELVDGVLVEKAMGYYESVLAAILVGELLIYLKQNKIGMVAGADGMMRLSPGSIRIPDVSFVSRARLRSHPGPMRRVPHLSPDLAVEILSPSNTPAEIARKLREYFAAGSRLVWVVDPVTRSAEVYTAFDRSVAVGADGSLDGGDVLPGFSISLRNWFAEAEAARPQDLP